MLDIFKNINVFVFDIDGVLTDGSLLVMDGGLMIRKMQVKDGYALQLAVKRGYSIFVISGGNSPQVKERLSKLGVKHVYMPVENKLEKLKELINTYQLQKEGMLYMGDDIPDLEVMQYCGLACCPADAVSEIKTISRYISPLKGGEGCVRDVIEKVMKLQGKWILDTHTPSL
ncbi:MAG TPA: HAD hydrolase family protein [Parafilimonas sp.]|nr:HAD hydrolase family protein [Parafilimonas sp.]